MALPGFIVAPFPHEEDKDYMISQGEDYFPSNDAEKINGDIAGGLHELFYSVGKKHGYKK